MTKPDFEPMTLRRVAIIQERQEVLFLALYAAIFVTFVGVMVALYTIREDILGNVKKD